MHSSNEILKIFTLCLTYKHGKLVYNFALPQNSAHTRHQWSQALDQYRQILHIDDDLLSSFNVLMVRLQLPYQNISPQLPATVAQ